MTASALLTYLTSRISAHVGAPVHWDIASEPPENYFPVVPESPDKVAEAADAIAGILLDAYNAKGGVPKEIGPLALLDAVAVYYEANSTPLCPPVMDTLGAIASRPDANEDTAC